MNADEIRELAAVYALGALDGEDLARFEALLEAGDDEAAAALREFEASLVALAAESAEAPPASVKAALMDGVGARGAARETVARPRPSPPSRRTWWPVIWAAAMAAGLAAIAVGLSVSVTYQRRLETLTREASALRGDLDRQRTELDRQRALVALVRDPATQIVALAGLEPAPSARARMIWNVREGGLLVAAGLPSAPEGKTYQLWAIAGQSAPVSAGVFDVDARGTGSLQVSPLPGIDKVTVFAVTLEPAGGVPAPSGKMFLAGKS